MLPAVLKKQMAPFINDGFVIKRSVFNKCLELHPMSEWDKIISEVNKLNRFVKKNNDFIRSYMSGLKIINIDSVSRLLIPKDLIAFASLDKEIVLSSSVNIIEVWDKELYEESVSISLKDFGSLTEEVMGNNVGNDIP
jgi:MraZ protein